MSLNKDIVNLILKDGSYYDKYINLNTKEIIIDDETKKSFLKTFDNCKLSSFFIDFYSVVGSPPVGKGIYLIPFDEILENNLYNSDKGLLMVGDDEMGLIVYDIQNDKVYEYEFDTEHQSKHYLENLQNNYINTWNSFEEFLDEYYKDEIILLKKGVNKQC